MENFKRILRILSIICMSGTAITDSIYFAIALLVVSSVSIVVIVSEMQSERKKKKK